MPHRAVYSVVSVYMDLTRDVRLTVLFSCIPGGESEQHVFDITGAVKLHSNEVFDQALSRHHAAVHGGRNVLE